MRDRASTFADPDWMPLLAGPMVLTAAWGGRRGGMPVLSAQACSIEPPMVCVAVRCGHWIEPLIRDSRAFGLSSLGSNDRVLRRRLAESGSGRAWDLQDCASLERLVSPAPVLAHASLVLDCEVVRHLDIESDHALYIGRVLAARVRSSDDLEMGK